MKLLSKYDVNQVLFDGLLEKYAGDIILVPDINDYKAGYKYTDLEDYKNKIAYDGKEYLIIREFCLLHTAGKELNEGGYWKQVIVRKVDNQTEDIKTGVTGMYAWSYITKMLHKYYTNEEINQRFAMFESEYDPSNIQEHIIYSIPHQLTRFKNTRKYDINGAHNDALCEIFPEAKEDILKLYNNRHEHPEYKAYVNYFVGYLCKRGHRKTYNWIVQRTNSILQKAMEYVGGHVVYANTDGFIVRNPERELPTSKELGDFKLEYSGETRFYQHSNWYVYEIDTDNEDKRLTGNIRLCVRDKVNLKKGIIVDYKRVLVKVNGLDLYETQDIKQITINEETML